MACAANPLHFHRARIFYVPVSVLVFSHPFDATNETQGRMVLSSLRSPRPGQHVEGG